MILAAESTHYVLPASVPTALVIVLAAAAVGVWVGLHVLKPRLAAWLGGPGAMAGRAAVGFLALLAVTQALERFLVLATNWPLWPIALLGALAVEIVLGLYALERRTVSRRAGFTLAALRVAIIAMVVAMLAQPVRPWTLDKTLQRFVAVLLDTSASMYVPDTQLGASEKMRLAEMLSVEGLRRPYAMDLVADEMDKVRQDLAAQGDWLASLGSGDAEARRKQLDARREALGSAFAAADKKLAEQAAAIGKPLDSPVPPDPRIAGTLSEVRQRLTGQVHDRLKEALALTAKDNARNLDGQRDRLLQTVRQAATDLTDLVSKTAAMGRALDEAMYAAFPAEVRAKIESAAARKRLGLARDVLLRPSTGAAGEKAARGPSLLESLEKKYTVKLYTFASAPTEVDPKVYATEYHGPDNPPGDAATLPPDQQETNYAAALEKVMTEMSGKRLSGVVLLSDGRHNAAKSVEPLVQRLSVLQVPVSSIVFGGEKPPLDAGIVSVEAPETVAARDKMYVNVDLKLDALAGKEVRVDLNDGSKTVSSQTVRVPNDTHRTRVQLADEPSATGLHHYAVDVQKFEGEVLTTNNQYPLSVSVTDERTKLLVIDGRPRWEFRYLKNLFTSRDRTVRLQYVLLEPDRIDGVPPPPMIAASASRPIDEVEASAMPADEAEWMKFDVILLGDVAPTALNAERQRILRKFVLDRGGTLIVVSGPTYMPHTYADTPLTDILPVAVRKSDQPVPAGAEKSFHIALTAEGAESVIMRQKVNPQENAEVWSGVPEIYWRHPIQRTKEGATVLAYALPPSPPPYMPQPRAAPAAGETPPGEDVLRQRREFERENALIVYHNVALGKVMFLGFDHTWRLRYRVGDTYHHRFWGQVLRWATANKLPAGTETVKLGTDRSRYPPHAPVRVQAKIARKDFTPIISNEVAVNVFAGNQLVLRKKLRYAEQSAGLYGADLGELPGGTYRVELDAPPAQPILAEDHVDKVSLEFSVEPSTPAEQAELAPDRGLLGRLASLTGGTVADPSRAERVLGSLGPPTEVEIEPHEYILWNSWPLLVLMVLAATTEWILRKKVGLA